MKTAEVSWLPVATHTDDTLPAAGDRGDGRALAIGSQAADRYRIVRLLGTGGMGEVYEAEDLIVGGRVALKTLLPELAGSSTAVERFRREISLARQVTDAHVCRLHDVGTHEGRLFITMELLSGTTLADRVRDEGARPLAEIENIARQLVAGLGALHAAGIVHRDFKTPNVILVGGRAVITDFGLARSTAGNDATLTTESGLLGTPAYMAPEQVEGRETTPASDVYALGVVLFELATGVLPFREDTVMATATARLQRDPPKPRERRPDLPVAWQTIILRCLARESAARPSLAEVVAAFGAPRGGRSTVKLAGLVAIVAIGIGAVAIVSSREPESVVTPTVFVPRFTTSNAAAREHHDAAMAALAADDWRAARDHLERAVAAAPEDPIVQARWAYVLGAVGFAERANVARDRAMAGRAKLDEEPRVWIEALDADERGDHDLAIARWRRLVVLASDHIDYRLGLIAALVIAGKVADARLALADAERVFVDEVSRVRFDLSAAYLTADTGDTYTTKFRTNRAAIAAVRLGRPRDRAGALSLLGWQQIRDDQLTDSERNLEQALSLAVTIGDAGLATEVRTLLADHYHAKAQFPAKERAYAESIAATRTLGDSKLLASLLHSRGLALLDLGRLDEADAAAREAIAIAEATQHHGSLGYSLFGRGRLHKHRSQLAEATDVLKRSYAIAESKGDPALRDLAASHWIDVLRMQGRDLQDPTLRELVENRSRSSFWSDVRVLSITDDVRSPARLRAARAAVEKARGPLQLAETRVELADLLRARGELVEAAELLELAEPVLRNSGSIPRAGRATFVLAQLVAARGEVARAVEMLDVVATEHARHGLLASSLEYRARAITILAKHDRAAAMTRRKTLLAEAQPLGMVAVEREVQAALKSP